jgi:hypothetical protein
VFLSPGGRVAPETIIGFISGPDLPVDIRVQDLSYQGGLGSFSFTITFDPGAASVVSAGPGPFLGSTGRPVSCGTPVIDPGSLSYNCTSSGPAPGPQGSGVLASVTLRPGSAFGSTDVQFTTSQLNVTFGGPIGHEPLAGGLLVAKCGDFNDDGGITISDTLLMIQHFGSDAGPPPSENWDASFDLNDDGRITVADLVIESRQFGRSCTAG